MHFSEHNYRVSLARQLYSRHHLSLLGKQNISLQNLGSQFIKIMS